METVYDKYEAVIGLEIHAQLHTASKAFSSDPNEYGSLPNHNISAISLGHPGTLPRLNENSVLYAIKLGLACKSNITPYNEFARKNYFYADLPKGYQITQDTTPICTGGHITIKIDGQDRDIALTRIHMEEDSGKSVHDQDPFNTLVDLNRAGVPLLELVSEPDMRTSEEAYQFVTEVRKLVRYLEICDGNMEEGSLRCDANISVRLKGNHPFGQKVEVKNMNSIRNVQRAIEFEIKRQIESVEAGQNIPQETRTFHADTGITTSMRSKEMANDYRYFPEPDLQPVYISKEEIDEVKSTLPPLPNELYKKYTQKLGLSAYDAGVLTDSKEVALFFEELIGLTNEHKAAANWVMGEVKSFLNDRAIHISNFPLKPSHIAALIELISSGKVSHSIASAQLFPALCESPESNVEALAKKLDIIQDSNEDSLGEFIDSIMRDNPAELERYRNGEKKLLGFFMGQLMKISRGKADPKKSNQLLRQKLEG